MISFMGMRINNNPDIDFPLVAVTAVRPGAGAEPRWRSRSPG
jgi:multidrug efflux pump subunit AcrB